MAQQGSQGLRGGTTPRHYPLSQKKHHQGRTSDVKIRWQCIITTPVLLSAKDTRFALEKSYARIEDRSVYQPTLALFTVGLQLASSNSRQVY